MSEKSVVEMQMFDAVGYPRHPHRAGRCGKQKRLVVDPNPFGEK